MLRVRFELPKVLALGDVRNRSDILTALASVVEVVERAIQRNFDEEGRPIPWMPLQPGYAAKKKKEFPGRGILERTGRLRHSIDVRVESRPQSGLADIIASSEVPYARFHHFGAGVLPWRQFLILTEGDVRLVGNALARSLKEIN